MSKQELLNTITSFIKFTPDNKAIDCWIEVGRDKNGHISSRLRVTDNADGTPLKVEYVDYES